jgi:hypothetical protein
MSLADSLRTDRHGITGHASCSFSLQRVTEDRTDNSNLDPDQDCHSSGGYSLTSHRGASGLGPKSSGICDGQNSNGADLLQLQFSSHRLPHTHPGLVQTDIPSELRLTPRDVTKKSNPNYL